MKYKSPVVTRSQQSFQKILAWSWNIYETQSQAIRQASESQPPLGEKLKNNHLWPRKSHKFKGNIPTSSSGNSLLGHIFDPQYDGYLDTDHKQKSENTKHNVVCTNL